MAKRASVFFCILYTFLTLPPCHAVPAKGTRMMAAGPSPFMIEAVRDVAGAGGNVADASVAAALTLAVTSPYYAALGGGGFAMLKLGEKVEALDFREVAPAGTGKQFFVDKPGDASLKGGTAIGVPGVAAGLWALHQKYGKLPWKRLFQVPLKLAQDGFQVSGEWAESTREESDQFNAAGKKFFFHKDGAPYRPGETLKQVALAQALLEFRNKGEAGFYQGAVAQDLVASVSAAGGVLTADDLKNYRVRWLEPITADFSKHRVYLMPPPSSGGIVIKTSLHLIEKLNVRRFKPYSLDELHLLGEILSHSFRGRALLGDPDFTKNPISQLTSAGYLQDLASGIRLDKTSHPPAMKEPISESTETTHFSIVDSAGKAVAFTVTLNGQYGSRVVSERFGIALNNEMDDFTTRPGVANQFGLIQGQANAVEPGKRPLSSMSPTLVEKDGQIVLSLGAPGGPRIISAVVQTLYRHLINGWDVDEAVQAARVHHQYLPNRLFLDDRRLPPETIAGLQARGHSVETGRVGKSYVVVRKSDGTLEAAFDSRGEGAAGGL